MQPGVKLAHVSINVPVQSVNTGKSGLKFTDSWPDEPILQHSYCFNKCLGPK